MKAEISSVYGNKVRTRICGLCWQNGDLLMVNHKGLTSADFWAPPGGGLEFGESVAECLEREFLQETGLHVSPVRFLFGCEYIRKPLHAIELFFEVQVKGGRLQKGDDPELPVIEEVRFLSSDIIVTMQHQHLHGIFRLVARPEDLMTLNGFFRI